jgi:hypothetical protein
MYLELPTALLPAKDFERTSGDFNFLIVALIRLFLLFLGVPLADLGDACLEEISAAD